MGVIQQLVATAENPAAALVRSSGAWGGWNRYLFSTCGPVGGAAQLPHLLPVAAALPCANLFLQEYKSRYLRAVLLRTNKTRYVLSKLFVAFISGAFAMLTAEVILLGISFLLDPAPSPLLREATMFGENALTALYQKSVWQFALFESGNLMLFCGVYSVLCMGVSVLWNHKYLSYSTGFLLANIVISELNRFGSVPWVTTCVNLWVLPVQRLAYRHVLLEYAGILLVSAAVFAVGFRIRSRNDV